jgi:protein involved in polysaccharide export with SLBB domain
MLHFSKTMKIRTFLNFITIFLCLTNFYLAEVSAQNQQADINSIDFAKINVDDITDDQIRQLMEKSAENGLTQQQIETVALSRGMPQVEIQKLRLRMNTIQTVGSSKQQGTAVKGPIRKEYPTRKRTDLKPDELLNQMFSLKADSFVLKEDVRKKIFGYSLFNTKDLTFEPSINFPTPENYILGPGDEVNINIWGVSQKDYKLIISPDGFIMIDNVGPVLVSGLTIEKASKIITTRLSSIYAGIRGSNPNTFAQISVGNLRSIKVILLGEVYLPGSYTLNSLAHAFNALYLSGGPDINGSLRNIEIIRNNKVIDSIDVYDFLFRGNVEKNILLNDQDIIKINPYVTRVKIIGEVKRPLTYEMKLGESLSDLLQFAGGFSDKAYTNRIKIFRNTSREKQIIDVAAPEFKHSPLQNGDSVIVEPILNRFANRVEIKGAVYRPGEYSTQDSLTILQLIEKAEGLKGDAFLSRAIIYRTKENYTLEAIPVDLASLITGTFPDIVLKREDIVVIPSIFDLQEEYYIQIDGDVRNPGQFPYMYNSTVEDIILQAGGFLESASMARLEIARRVKDVGALTTSNKVADIFYYPITKDLKLSDAGKKFVLEPFDRIFIRRSPGYEEQITATVEGEVLFPGEYSISSKDERISDLILRSGGLTPDAFPKGASLIRVFKVDEKERIKAFQPGGLFYGDNLNNMRTSDNQPENNADVNMENKDKKLQVLDSIVAIAAHYINKQAIGIDLEMILSNPHTKYDLILQEGDKLMVPKLLQTVSISGELLHPITARYDKRNNFRGYIRSAGGFTSKAKPSKSYVIYANGSVDVTRSIMGLKNYPKLEPGAQIIVPKKEEKKSLTTGEVISISSALASMALILVTLLNTF